MDFKFSKDSGETEPQTAPGEKKNQNALLVLLLILVGGFAYIYFFTGLIRPLEAQKPAAPPPAAAPQVVKLPLPPRTDETATAAVKSPEQAAAAKTAVPVPTASPVPAAKPAPATAKPTATPPAASTKAKEEIRKSEPAKPAAVKPAPTAAAEIKTAGAKATPEAKKPVVADKKSTVAPKAAPKPSTTAAAKPEPAAAGKKAARETWVLLVGNYVLGEALSTAMGQVRKAGYEPIVKASARKKTAMNRLFVSDFTDRATAQATLEKLKRLTSDAFVIEQGGKFSLFAGSYLQNESAHSEKERLGAAGFSITIRHTDIEIPSQSLTVGPFSTQKAADAARAKLNSAGIKASLLQK